MNQGPADLQSAALTTELCTHRHRRAQNCFRERAKAITTCNAQVNTYRARGGQRSAIVSKDPKQSKRARNKLAQQFRILVFLKIQLNRRIIITLPMHRHSSDIGCRIHTPTQFKGVWRNGSASDSRSEGWEFESLCPHFLGCYQSRRCHPELRSRKHRSKYPRYI